MVQSGLPGERRHLKAQIDQHNAHVQVHNVTSFCVFVQTFHSVVTLTTIIITIIDYVSCGNDSTNTTMTKTLQHDKYCSLNK